jgi:uncharacterized membrane protein YsdA (DUF1294 family)
MSPTTALCLLLINGLAYLAFRFDKRAAVEGRRRIPEKHLLLLAALGGSPAALFAQQTLRHKTRKQPFASLLLVIASLQALALIWWLARAV